MQNIVNQLKQINEIVDAYLTNNTIFIRLNKKGLNTINSELFNKLISKVDINYDIKTIK